MKRIKQIIFVVMTALLFWGICSTTTMAANVPTVKSTIKVKVGEKKKIKIKGKYIMKIQQQI